MDEQVFKVVLQFIGPVLTAILAVSVSIPISNILSKRQKKRELELAMAERFYSSYGKFFSTWKEWNFTISNGNYSPEEFLKKQREMMALACVAEGELESVLLKISSERSPSMEQLDSLGNLRQAYQVLRERIRDGREVTYGSSNHKDYLEFKKLSTLFGNMIAASETRLPSEAQAYNNFQVITDNQFEGRWRNVGR